LIGFDNQGARVQLSGMSYGIECSRIGGGMELQVGLQSPWRSVFTKTGTRRQSQLVATALSAIPIPITSASN